MIDSEYGFVVIEKQSAYEDFDESLEVDQIADCLKYHKGREEEVSSELIEPALHFFVH